MSSWLLVIFAAVIFAAYPLRSISLRRLSSPLFLTFVNPPLPVRPLSAIVCESKGKLAAQNALLARSLHSNLRTLHSLRLFAPPPNLFTHVRGMCGMCGLTSFPGIPVSHIIKLLLPSLPAAGLAKKPYGWSFRHAFLSSDNRPRAMPPDMVCDLGLGDELS